jgi:hypothetical protein
VRRIGTLIISADRRPFLDGGNLGVIRRATTGTNVMVLRSGLKSNPEMGEEAPQLSSRIASAATAPTPS